MTVLSSERGVKAEKMWKTQQDNWHRADVEHNHQCHQHFENVAISLFSSCFSCLDWLTGQGSSPPQLQTNSDVKYKHRDQGCGENSRQNDVP